MRIGLALIGAGSVVRERHLPAIQSLEEFEVVAVFDPDPQAGGAHTASSLEEAVRAEGVQAVVVASPNAFHRAGVEAAAAAGRHILCEKPIATTLRDARAMVDAAGRAGVVLQIGFHHRFTSEFLLARRLVDAGVIGRVRAFQAQISEPFSLVPGSANYRLKPELSGGLSLIDFGSHRIDQLRALCGDFAEISAQIANVGPGHALDDNIALAVRTTAGALGAISFQRFSRGAVTPTTLVGDKGVLCFSAYVVNPFQAAPVAVFTEQPLPDDVRAFRRPNDWWSPPAPGWTALWPPFENPYVAEYRAFADAIRHSAAPPVTGEDGYRALEIVLGAYKAFAERRTVTLPLDPDEHIPPPIFGTV